MEYRPDYVVEFARRVEIVRWMGTMKWPEAVMDAVMYDDNPHPEDVRRLVYFHGPEKALELLEKML